MKLLIALIRWIFSRLFLLLMIAGIVILGAILKDWWEQRQFHETQLQKLQTDLGELHRAIRERRSDLTLERQYLQLRSKEPSRWTSPFEWYRWNKEMEALAALIDRKNIELRNLRLRKDQLVREVAASSYALSRTQDMITSILRKSVKTILLLCAIVFLGPICWKAFWYFGIARLAMHAPPVRLEKSQGGSVEVDPSRKTLPVRLDPGKTLYTRMAWLHQYTPGARKRTRFLLDWKAPFISYAAGLSELTEVTTPVDGETTQVVLSSAENPDTFLCEVRIENHPGIAVYPSQVVAISGNMKLNTRWTLLNLHSWVAGRLRYIIFSGTGSLYIKGMAGVDPVPISGRGVRLSEHILIAFETRLSFSTVRTETFWPYYRRLTPLFDYHFEGDGTVLRQTASDAKRIDSATIRVFDVLLNGIGKLLGL